MKKEKKTVLLVLKSIGKIITKLCILSIVFHFVLGFLSSNKENVHIAIGIENGFFITLIVLCLGIFLQLPQKFADLKQNKTIQNELDTDFFNPYGRITFLILTTLVVFLISVVFLIINLTA